MARIFEVAEGMAKLCEHLNGQLARIRLLFIRFIFLSPLMKGLILCRDVTLFLPTSLPTTLRTYKVFHPLISLVAPLCLRTCNYSPFLHLPEMIHTRLMFNDLSYFLLWLSWSLSVRVLVNVQPARLCIPAAFRFYLSSSRDCCLLGTNSELAKCAVVFLLYVAFIAHSYFFPVASPHGMLRCLAFLCVPVSD